MDERRGVGIEVIDMVGVQHGALTWHLRIKGQGHAEASVSLDILGSLWGSLQGWDRLACRRKERTLMGGELDRQLLDGGVGRGCG